MIPLLAAVPLRIWALALLLVSLLTSIGVLRHQRDTARSDLAQARLTIAGYALASQAIQETAKAHSQAARDQGRQTEAMVREMAAQAPTTDEDARKWAIAAGARIR